MLHTTTSIDPPDAARNMPGRGKSNVVLYDKTGRVASARPSCRSMGDGMSRSRFEAAPDPLEFDPGSTGHIIIGMRRDPAPGSFGEPMSRPPRRRDMEWAR